MAYNDNPSYLKLSGGTMTGALILNADPVTALGASTKQYVDNAITAVNPATSVYAASTTDIPGTYTHVAGIGDTFLTTATGAFSVDGVSPPVASRFLFKNQSVGPNTAAFNGVYNLTTNGTGITGTLFTRALDYDQPSDINNTGVINVVNGTANALTGWLITSTVTTVGTDAINYTKYNNAPGTVTQYDVIVGGANGALASVGPGSTGQFLQSGGNAANPAYSTATLPSTATSTGTILRADGTNWVASTPTFPNAASTALKHIKSDGTNFVTTTVTYPDASVTAGKVIVSDGTNYIASTPTFPNASATSRKIIVSDGTNWTASTETWATPGSSGNVLKSDGTNWTSSASSSVGNLLLTSSISLTNAQLKALNTTPVQILAGAGSGKVIIPLGISCKLIYGGNNAFSAEYQLFVGWDSSPFTDGKFWLAGKGGQGGGATNKFTTATANAYMFMGPTTAGAQTQTASLQVGYPATTVENGALFIQSDINFAGNAANDNTMNLVISYYVVSQ